MKTSSNKLKNKLVIPILLAVPLTCLVGGTAEAEEQIYAEQTTKHCVVKNSNMHFIVTATKTATILDNGQQKTDFTIDSFSTLGWIKKNSIKKKNILGIILRVKARQKHTNKAVACDIDIWSQREIFYGVFIKK